MVFCSFLKITVICRYSDPRCLSTLLLDRSTRTKRWQYYKIGDIITSGSICQLHSGGKIIAGSAVDYWGTGVGWRVERKFERSPFKT